MVNNSGFLVTILKKMHFKKGEEKHQIYIYAFLQKKFDLG